MFRLSRILKRLKKTGKNRFRVILRTTYIILSNSKNIHRPTSMRLNGLTWWREEKYLFRVVFKHRVHGKGKL